MALERLESEEVVSLVSVKKRKRKREKSRSLLGLLEIRSDSSEVVKDALGDEHLAPAAPAGRGGGESEALGEQTSARLSTAEKSGHFLNCCVKRRVCGGD